VPRKPPRPLSPATLQWIRDHPILLCSCKRELLHLRLLNDVDVDVQHGENPEHQMSGQTHQGIARDDIVFFVHGLSATQSGTSQVQVGGSWLAAVHARMFD
jgi:hypothetical protein